MDSEGLLDSFLSIWTKVQEVALNDDIEDSISRTLTADNV